MAKIDKVSPSIRPRRHRSYGIFAVLLRDGTPVRKMVWRMTIDHLSNVIGGGGNMWEGIKTNKQTNKQANK